jgi:hypothetical protein
MRESFSHRGMINWEFHLAKKTKYKQMKRAMRIVRSTESNPYSHRGIGSFNPEYELMTRWRACLR